MPDPIVNYRTFADKLVYFRLILGAAAPVTKESFSQF